MTTPVRPFREKRHARLPAGAVRWLLGAEARMDEHGGIKNGSIVRWRYLSARKASRQEWEEYLAEFWAAHRDAVLARHIMLYPGTRPLRWWQYDTPEPLPPGETQYEYLRRHYLLTAAERKHAPRRRTA